MKALLTVCVLILTACLGGSQAQTIMNLTRTVDRDTADVEETISSGAMDIQSSDLELGTERGPAQIIGLWYQDIQIPAGAVITRAYVQFTNDVATTANANPCSLEIWGEASDNAQVFTNQAYAVSPRSKTQTSQKWNPDAYTVVQEQGPKQRTPNLNRIIQEIIDRPGWSQGNSLALIITGTGTREVESYEGANSGDPGHNPSQAPTLVIEYLIPNQVIRVVDRDTADVEETISSGAMDIQSSDLELGTERGPAQMIGIWFNNLTIPQGAVITSAHIQFTNDVATTANADPCALEIRVENTDNSQVFTNQDFAVSTRTSSNEKINWNPDPFTVVQEQGPKEKSPNLAKLVQLIVDKPGWTSGNALSFIITGSGTREVESFEGATGHGNVNMAPTLTVSYILPNTIEKTVKSDTSDVEETISSGAMDIQSSDLELGTERGPAQLVGIWYDSLDIPQGAYIKHAYIQFTNDVATTANADPCSLEIRCEASDNAVIFDNNAYAVSPRSTTSASVAWNPDPFTVVQERGPKEKTPDLRRIVQEVVNRQGWTENNSLAFIISGSGTREVESFEGSNSGDPGHSANQAPTLIIEWSYVGDEDGPQLLEPYVAEFPIKEGENWTYHDSGMNLGGNWKDSAYIDNYWKRGGAELGYGDNDEKTVISFGPNSGDKYITTYFRLNFEIKPGDLFNADSLLLEAVVDDGALFYVNGTEVARYNMPSGAIDYQTYSSTIISGSDESRWNPFIIPSNLLHTGVNLIAVEIHNRDNVSSDLSFNLRLSPLKKAVKLVEAGSNWKYYDGNDLNNLSWASRNYNDNSWNAGNAPLGYGNGNEATTVSYGADAANKHITTWFRKTITINDVDGYQSVRMRLRRDDGAVVYFNGFEVYRNNLPVGAIGRNTKAIRFIEGNEEDNWIEVYLPKNNLVQGSNVIAVEIHQDAAYSSDLTFDMELEFPEENTDVNYNGYFVNCNPSENNKFACFTSVDPDSRDQRFLIPGGTHSQQLLMKSTEDTYTAGGIIPNGNDFTGYIPENGSSKAGWLAVNHENNPGGVSLLRIELNETTMLWEVKSITAVDFSDVVKSERNCSGGVTPWGTSVTCEETYSSGDANGDGYTDVGWCVEIDPVTGKIKDYDGDGKGDKVWPMGRMSHENAVFAPDSIRVFQGEDGGTGCVYKFVMDNKADLSSGTLYVLKRDNTDPTLGEWVQVPNTTQTERNTARDIAGSLGGYRFGGVEDVEIDPIDGWVYFTEKGAGDIWRFEDMGMTVRNLGRYAQNMPFKVHTENGENDENWQTGNDNLVFDEDGNLFVLQDGGRDHIWVLYRGHNSQNNPRVEVFATTPNGSEPCGMTFTPDFKYAFISMQNASGSNTQTQVDAAGNTVINNASTTWVIARKEFLGKFATVPEVYLGGDTTICEGGSVTLSLAATPDFTPVWSNGSVGQSITVSQSGTYWVALKGNNGKTAYDTVQITVNALPRVNLGPDQTLIEGSKIILDAGAGFASYTWSTGSSNQTIEVTTNGNYSVSVKDAAGCAGSDAVQISFTTGVVDDLGQYSLKAYPNPFRNSTSIEVNLMNGGAIGLELYDVNGKLITRLAEGRLETGKHHFDLNADELNLKPGVYMLRISYEGRSSVLRLVNR